MGAKRVVGYLSLGVAAFVVCLVALAPASLVLSRLAERAPGLQLDGAEIDGTLYAGTARRLRYAGREFAELRWRWSPAALLGGRFAYRVWLREPERGTDLSALAGLGWDRAGELDELRGELQLPRALQLAGMPPPPVNGRLRLAIDELRFRGRRPLAASGEVYADGVHTAFGKTLQLGDYRLDLYTDAEAEAIRGRLSDAGGPIELGGELSLAPSGAYRLEARLGTRSGADPALTYMLGLLGAPGPDQRWQLQVDGRLHL